jgi:TfoX/Sxy family transcriptional regulator of competence genes
MRYKRGMAWVKIPAEHHPLFLAALPKDPRIQTLKMFGGVAGKVNGKMFGGTFGRSVIVRLSQADRAEALALEGAEPFDPMGHGPSKDMVLLPEDLMHDEEGLRAWLVRAIRSTASMAAAKPAKKPAAKKSSSRR